MKSKIKRHIYIVTNLYLLLFLPYQLVIVPFFKDCYDNIEAIYSLEIEWLLFFSKYWYIFDPLMFVAANCLLYFCIKKYEKFFDRPVKFYYRILIRAIILTYLGLVCCLFMYY